MQQMLNRPSPARQCHSQCSSEGAVASHCLGPVRARDGCLALAMRAEGWGVNRSWLREGATGVPQEGQLAPEPPAQDGGGGRRELRVESWEVQAVGYGWWGQWRGWTCTVTVTLLCRVHWRQSDRRTLVEGVRILLKSKAPVEAEEWRRRDTGQRSPWEFAPGSGNQGPSFQRERTGREAPTWGALGPG